MGGWVGGWVGGWGGWGGGGGGGGGRTRTEQPPPPPPPTHTHTPRACVPFNLFRSLSFPSPSLFLFPLSRFLLVRRGGRGEGGGGEGGRGEGGGGRGEGGRGEGGGEGGGGEGGGGRGEGGRGEGGEVEYLQRACGGFEDLATNASTIGRQPWGVLGIDGCPHVEDKPGVFQKGGGRGEGEGKGNGQGGAHIPRRECIPAPVLSGLRPPSTTTHTHTHTHQNRHTCSLSQHHNNNTQRAHTLTHSVRNVWAWHTEAAGEWAEEEPRCMPAHLGLGSFGEAEEAEAAPAWKLLLCTILHAAGLAGIYPT